jgi:ornithine cyclodeaminase
MSIKHDLLYLCQADVLRLGGADMALAVHDMERVFSLKEQQDVRVPDKVSMGFGNSIAEEKTKGRINAMPGYLGGEYNMAGIKWIGSNPGNIARGLPRASAITILNDPETKFPLAIMDGTLISAVRTGAVGGVAARHLSHSGSGTLLLIGAGLQSQTQLEAVLVTRPELRRIYINDIVPERAEAFAAEMSSKTGRTVTAVSDGKAHARQADIIITATGSATPVIDADWLESGTLYINIGGFECTYATVMKADRRCVDNWEAVKHRNTSAVARMVNEGLLSDADIHATIGEVINGSRAGRTSDNDIVYFNCVGMGIADIAIATRLYRRAVQEHVGQTLPYWN